MSVLILVEPDAEGAAVTSLEAVTFARGMADSGGWPVHAVVVGPVDEPAWTALVDQLGAYGVASVRHAQGEELSAYAAAAWAAALVEAAGAVSARVLLASGTPRGNEILAHAAARLDVAMAANAVAADSASPLVVSRQVVGGAALEEMRLSDSGVGIVSVAGHACEPVAAPSPSVPEVVTFSPELSPADLVARVARVEPAPPDESAALTSARVVVGAGRGAGGPDGFKDLLSLAELVGGALGVSRVVTSLGWRPHHEQVGQTGSRIAPDLYIPCGISGAIQHWAGCQSAKTIIAINTDEDAPMVTRADYAVIGDLHEVVPAINDELRRRRG
ncbi:MAG TPA: electron transfer flavoprotein subunit alpha/FixB family protein [Nocardioidaceae bacterium]|nr:electron transfer flavoprotein subunit alpha/FixB family protein [Nocardioidaceae bacterium]